MAHVSVILNFLFLLGVSIIIFMAHVSVILNFLFLLGVPIAVNVPSMSIVPIVARIPPRPNKHLEITRIPPRPNKHLEIIRIDQNKMITGSLLGQKESHSGEPLRALE